jgi:hypothetical protein
VCWFFRSFRQGNGITLIFQCVILTHHVSKFKKAIRSSISMPIPRHYSYGPRKLNIILTQLRCNASFLNHNLCKVKILSNASCNCGAPCENSHKNDYIQLGLDNIRKKKKKEKRKENKYFWRCVLVL